MCEYVNFVQSSKTSTGDPIQDDSGLITVICTTTHILTPEALAEVKKGTEASLMAMNNYDKAAGTQELQGKIDKMDQALN